MPAERKERLIPAVADARRHEHDDIFGPDMGTDETCMAWVKDEIGRAVGLPPVLGGIPLDELGATGWGIRQAAEGAARHCHLGLRGARVVIHGFGAVGKHSARFLAKCGAVLIAASDSRGAIHDAAGIDVARFIALKDGGGSVTDYDRGRRLDRDAILDVAKHVSPRRAALDLYTGSGNTLNMMHPRTIQLLMDSLRYWILEMHVDGFRFDLASALARELHDVDQLRSFCDVIHQDPVVSQVKLIAEPWDLGEGGYQVGNFPVGWAEWNGRYRDAVRRYWRGDGGQVAELAYRLTGSSDLYQSDGRRPSASVNFVTSHDGFTLADLVSCNVKHTRPTAPTIAMAPMRTSRGTHSPAARSRYSAPVRHSVAREFQRCGQRQRLDVSVVAKAAVKE